MTLEKGFILKSLATKIPFLLPMARKSLAIWEGC